MGLGNNIVIKIYKYNSLLNIVMSVTDADKV